MCKNKKKSKNNQKNLCISTKGKFTTQKKLTENQMGEKLRKVKMSIDSIVTKFEKDVKSLDKITISNLSKLFRTAIEALPKRASADPKKKEEKEKKLNTWARLWVSKDYGGRQRFPEEYDRIKSETKKTSFQILSDLRTLVESDDRWKEWYEWVQLEYPDAPRDPPSARQPKKETKPKPAAKKKSDSDDEKSKKVDEKSKKRTSSDEKSKMRTEEGSSDDERDKMNLDE